MKYKKSLLSRIFDVFNYTFLGLFACTAILPFLYVLACSFSSEKEILERPFYIIPRNVQLAAYKYIFSSPTLPRAFMISVFVTITGAATAMFLTLTLAYPLSKKYLLGRKVLLSLISFTLVFGGGMIPTFLVIKDLGMLNKFWALILPGAISTWNLLVVKNFFQELPQELEDSARVDGCSSLGTFIRIVLPLSMPVIATFTLFYAVGYWNDYRSSLLYITDNKKWPLQLVLRQIVLMAAGNIDGATFDAAYTQPPLEASKNAVIVFGTVPILVVYPFLQKHFVKGIMIGAIKG
ncbi:protein LplC [Thermoclostridium stercorarium subsp. stercorarium DSM 8532]|jgi:putative aldouronate transport system permease protein|uniref:Protein LplC n=3 Tax=Thermoclostridium stercorarium TaxID=1510 RepID=L7VL97_THES1|nr:carbohydrate ABC transporter permease [Thermoclostridium stercorarium]AGC67251.1 protein LplC [Thermoclostridium stercorarium subsp. stercorarium DSM 8532]AGI38322.1 ABC transporter periplasmic subunit-2 [Thermoclostridium stercorarium subsp. stercorarium DSM 8532]ANW97757.1 ABC transporter permease [Thermoclostridium stercorarium subsp. thermolacticum DSM 2910]ANX00284.1 ABC transporter permease [Thermoclostridium stercorarium subsp. leptospartum DSM 9219]UZQ85829.1 carbohydrate ABC transp